MGWGKKIRKAWKKVAKVTDVVLPGASQLTGYAIDAATHKSAVAEKENDQKKAIAAQEAAAKASADADYYDQIMKNRRQQIAGNTGSQTNFTTEDGAFGNFDAGNLGGFDPDTGVFGKKRKVVG